MEVDWAKPEHGHWSAGILPASQFAGKMPALRCRAR